MTGLPSGERIRWPAVWRWLLCAAFTTGPGCASAPDAGESPRAVVRAFLHSLDEHDAEGAMALLDEDFVFRSGEGGYEIRRNQMSDVLAWDAAADGTVEIEEMRAEGDTVRARLVERNQFTELLELEPWTVQATFVVRDGRIVEELAEEVVGEAASFNARFARALEPVIRWAEETRPEAASRVFTDGRVARFDGPTARRLLQLIRTYRREASPR